MPRAELHGLGATALRKQAERRIIHKMAAFEQAESRRCEADLAAMQAKREAAAQADAELQRAMKERERAKTAAIRAELARLKAEEREAAMASRPFLDPDERISRGKMRVARAKDRAEKAGLPFDLDVSQMDWPERCPVLGILLDYAPCGRQPNSVSLDRLDAKKGYTMENVRVISDKANRIKADGTRADHEAVVAYLRANGL